MILGEEGWPIATAKGMQARQGSTVKQVTLQMYDYSIHMYNIYILYYIYLFIYLWIMVDFIVYLLNTVILQSYVGLLEDSTWI